MDLNNTSNNSMEKTKEAYLGKLVGSFHACKRVKTRSKKTQKSHFSEIEYNGGKLNADVATTHEDKNQSIQGFTLSSESSQVLSQVSVSLCRLAPRLRWVSRSILSPFLSRPRT